MAATSLRTVAAVLVAGGDGRRLGGDVPKAFSSVGGRSLLEHAVARFRDHPAVRDVVVVAPAAWVERAHQLSGAVVVAGGSTRRQSVSAGLAVVASDVEVVLVHDVARPFVPADVISRVIDAVARGADAVVPVVAVHDTVRRTDDVGDLAEIVDRATLVAIQTPQGFARAVLDRAHATGGPATAHATDDAALVEALGVRIVAVDGADESFKITRPFDLVVAEALAGRA
jgi:2-C-methyl-D-erythritol 4-phosphate cytidylyltransferase